MTHVFLCHPHRPSPFMDVFIHFMALLKVQFRELTGNGMRERGHDRQQRATGRTRIPGCCSEDRASVHGMRALSTELSGAHSQIF